MEQAVNLLTCFDHCAHMIMKAAAYPFGQRNFSHEIEGFRKDLKLLVGEAVFWTHMPGQFPTPVTTARDVVEATWRDIELAAANGTRKGCLLSNTLQDLCAS